MARSRSAASKEHGFAKSAGNDGGREQAGFQSSRDPFAVPRLASRVLGDRCVIGIQEMHNDAIVQRNPHEPIFPVLGQRRHVGGYRDRIRCGWSVRWRARRAPADRLAPCPRPRRVLEHGIFPLPKRGHLLREPPRRQTKQLRPSLDVVRAATARSTPERDPFPCLRDHGRSYLFITGKVDGQAEMSAAFDLQFLPVLKARLPASLVRRRAFYDARAHFQGHEQAIENIGLDDRCIAMLQARQNRPRHLRGAGEVFLPHALSGSLVLEQAAELSGKQLFTPSGMCDRSRMPCTL